MPLENAKVGTPGFGRNIETEMKAGKPQKQAVAIAYNKARGDADFEEGKHPRGSDGKFGSGGGSAKPARQKAFKATNASAAAEIGYLKRQKASPEKVRAVAKRYEESANNYEKSNAKDLAGWESGKPERPDLADPRKPEVRKHREKYVQDLREAAKELNQYAEHIGGRSEKDSAMKAGCVFARNGEYFFRHPGTTEHQGPFATESEAIGAAIKAGAMDDEDPCWEGYEMAGMKNKGGKPVPNCIPDADGPKYNREAVEKAIKSNRTGKIGGRESKMIHALLKGNQGYKSRADATPKVGDTVKTVYGQGKVVKVNAGSVVVHVAGEDRKMAMKQYSVMNDSRADSDESEIEAEKRKGGTKTDSDEAVLGRADAKPESSRVGGLYAELRKLQRMRKRAMDLEGAASAKSYDADIRRIEGFIRKEEARDDYVAEEAIMANAPRFDAASTIHQEGDEWVINVDHDGSETILRLDVKDYTEEEALEYATMLPQYTYGKFQTRVDSLPPLERALRMADSLYAKADAAAMSTYVVGYVNSVGKSDYTEVKAASRDEAQRKAKKELGGECKRIFKVSEMASRADAESRSSLERRAKEKFEASERALRAKDYPLYNRLWDEAQALVEKAQKARTDAERDLPGSGTGEGGYDDAQDPLEKAEGKLTKTEREGIGRPGSEEREDMPEGVFLKPGTKTYPVKEKKNGRWVYDRELLLAAARRARLNKDEALAAHADKIREREFESKTDAERDLPGSGTTGSAGV
jgi:hypothetical protein